MTCPDCHDTGTAPACRAGPDVHDPHDNLGCDSPVPCPCQAKASP